MTARRIADGDATGAVTALAGDRIVVEIGFSNTTGGTSITGTLNFGDDSATDLGDNETDTAANNPFVEFSTEIIFEALATAFGAVFHSLVVEGARPAGLVVSGR